MLYKYPVNISQNFMRFCERDVDLGSSASLTIRKGFGALNWVKFLFFVYKNFSLNWTLRSEAHFELAKIEEDIEQMDSAKANLLKVKRKKTKLNETVFVFVELRLESSTMEKFTFLESIWPSNVCGFDVNCTKCQKILTIASER